MTTDNIYIKTKNPKTGKKKFVRILDSVEASQYVGKALSTLQTYDSRKTNPFTLVKVKQYRFYREDELEEVLNKKK